MKKLTFILALALLLTACGEKTVRLDSESTTADAEDTTAPNEPPIEKCDYGGKTFTIYAPDWGMYSLCFFADEQNGDVINDKILEREALVEDRLGVSVKHRLEGSIDEQYSKVSASVMAGDHDFDLILTHCITGVGSMLTDGLLLDWNRLEYVDLAADYYNQNANETLSLYGKQYYAISDYMLADPNCMLFNKSLVDKFGLEDPYAITKDGKFTLDKLIEMSAAVSGDLNGDGTFDINDRYGFSTPQNWVLASFYPASDIYLVSKDRSGSMELSFYSDRTVSLVEKLDTLLNKTHDAFSYPTSAPENEWLTMRSDRVLFAPESIHSLGDYRDSEVDYGILPYPKFDENQTDYIANDWSGLMAVPSNAEDTDMIGKAVELLSYYSRSTTIPAYYDVVLAGKLSRDENSKEMLDIIFANVIYDPGVYFFGWGKTQTLFHSIKSLVAMDKSGDITSLYKSNEDAAKVEIGNFLNSLPQ